VVTGSRSMVPVVAVVVLVACGASTRSGPAATQAAQRTLTVSAAASGTGVFDQLSDQFQAANPGGVSSSTTVTHQM
jgi:ABC-type molybdate transport system substrate-binding protein